MMTMYHRGNFYYFLLILLLVVFLPNCKNSKVKDRIEPKNKIFLLADSTQLELPNTFILSENLNSENRFVAQVYADFLANLETPPMKVTFFVDSLKPYHHLAAYQVESRNYDQNMAALLNTKLTQQFQQLDKNQECHIVSKVESMQYASTAWNALKFKFLISPNPSDENCDPNIENTFATIFYYNAQNKAYFFLEYHTDNSDLDAFLRMIRLQ